MINADGKVELRTLSPGYDDEEETDATLKQQDPKEKMTYTEQAAKRNHCQRLTRLVNIRLHCMQNLFLKMIWQ